VALSAASTHTVDAKANQRVRAKATRPITGKSNMSQGFLILDLLGTFCAVLIVFGIGALLVFCVMRLFFD